MAIFTSLDENVKHNLVLDPATITATVTGDTVDMQGYSELQCVAAFGTPGDTLSGSVKVEAYVQATDDTSSWALAADADLTNYVSGSVDSGVFAVVDADAEANRIYITSYRGSKRYTRTILKATSLSNGVPAAVNMVQGRPTLAPID